MNIFKGKTKLVIFIQIIFIGIIIIGSTFAVRYLYETISTSLTTANIGVIYTGESKIDTTGIIPITEEDIETEAVKLEFTVKGAESNPNNVDIVYDVSLNDINIGKGLISKDFKWKLYKNGILNASSDFSDIGTINGNNVQTYERAILTNEVQRLPKYTDEPDSYTLYIYILDTRELQTSLMGQTFNAKIKIETYTTKGGSTKRSKYNSLVENNLPNAPELAEGMIPVKYDGTNWVKAYSTNTNNDWYNYSSKKWANAVMVSGNSIIDKSGNNNNGIIHGEPTISNGEITFDGVDDYVDLGMANREFSTNITIVARVKMLKTDVKQHIICNQQSAGFALYYNASNKFYFTIYDATTALYKGLSSPTTYSLNTWYTVVGRYDGIEESLWIDGTKVASQTISITPMVSIMPLIIGANPESNGTLMDKGNFTTSNIMMYERALTDTEITNLSNNINNHSKSRNDNLLFDFNNFTSVDQREVYMNAKEGTKIAENDILTYHVWIPRYRYKLFNVESKTLSELGLSEPPQIDIIFESETAEISNGTCNGIYENPANECYYSHPSFWWDDDSDGVREAGEELKGIWVGKFETTGYADIPTIKPNQVSLRNQQVSKQFTTSQKMGTSTYLTANGVSEIDAHMAKNVDWGTVAYLTQTKYGRCTNGKCAEVEINNNANYITGYGAVNKATTGWSATSLSTNEFGTSNTITKQYNTNIGVLASTTGNIYGIYDMSGGSHEYVMGVLQDNEGKPRSGNDATKNSGFTGKAYDGTNWIDITSVNFPDSKYYDLYTVANISNRKLGDATGEVKSWYNDSSLFMSLNYPWIHRSCYYANGISAGLFYFHHHESSGSATSSISFRSVLINK